MGRQPCCDNFGVKKGPWTAEEDKKLVDFILTHGQCCWRAVPKLAGLRRCGKSCRLRWTNYLRPDLKRGLLNEAEEQLVMDLHARLGNRYTLVNFFLGVLTQAEIFNLFHVKYISKCFITCRWSKIAARLPGRTDNEIKNHWHTHIKKKLIKMGIDPVTHQPLHKQDNKGAAASHDVIYYDHQPNFSGDQQQISKNNCEAHASSSCNTTPTESSEPSSNDDPLMSYKISDSFLEDSKWNFPVEYCEFGMFSPEGNCPWFLEHKDIGDDCFGL